MLSTSCSRTAQRAEADDDFNHHVERLPTSRYFAIRCPTSTVFRPIRRYLCTILPRQHCGAATSSGTRTTPDNLAMRDLLEAVYTNYDGMTAKAPITRLSTHI